jgi:hypothetical protein
MIGPDFDWTHVISVLFGSGGATFFVRMLTKRALDQLDEITQKLESCTIKLLIIENELKSFQPFREMIINHDRKIVELDVKSDKIRCRMRDANI